MGRGEEKKEENKKTVVGNKVVLACNFLDPEGLNVSEASAPVSKGPQDAVFRQHSISLQRSQPRAQAAPVLPEEP